MTETEIQETTAEDELRYSLWLDTYIWMAIECDLGEMPDADEPGASAYIDGYISGCPATLKERVHRLVTHRIKSGDDQDSYQKWMNGLKGGVRMHLERKGRGECRGCADGNKSHAG